MQRMRNLIPQTVVNTEDLGDGRLLLRIRVGRGARAGMYRLHVGAYSGRLVAESQRMFRVVAR